MVQVCLVFACKRHSNLIPQSALISIVSPRLHTINSVSGLTAIRPWRVRPSSVGSPRKSSSFTFSTLNAVQHTVYEVFAHLYESEDYCIQVIFSVKVDDPSFVSVGRIQYFDLLRFDIKAVNFPSVCQPCYVTVYRLLAIEWNRHQRITDVIVPQNEEIRVVPSTYNLSHSNHE